MGVRGPRGGWESLIWVPKYLPMINPDPDPDRHQDVHHGHLEDHSDKVEQKFKKYPNPWQLPAILGVTNLTHLPRPYQEVVPRWSWDPPRCRRRRRVGTMTNMFPRVQGFSPFLNFCSILSGSGSQMLKGHTLVSAGHHDHGQNVPKGPVVQVLFEFSLYLIRKWFPDTHGAHPDVGRS